MQELLRQNFLQGQIEKTSPVRGTLKNLVALKLIRISFLQIKLKLIFSSFILFTQHFPHFAELGVGWAPRCAVAPHRPPGRDLHRSVPLADRLLIISHPYWA